MIERLQRIKALRLMRKEKLLATQRDRLQRAHSRHQEAEKICQDYRTWRLTEENRLFELCQKEKVDRTGLEDWLQKVAGLRKQEANLEQQTAALAQILAEERTRLRERQQEVHKARQQCEKFAELHRRELIFLRAQGDYREEQEQEEFHSKIRMQ